MQACTALRLASCVIWVSVNGQAAFSNVGMITSMETGASVHKPYLKLLKSVVFVMQGLKASLNGGLVQSQLPVKLHSLSQSV